MARLTHVYAKLGVPAPSSLVEPARSAAALPGWEALCATEPHASNLAQRVRMTVCRYGRGSTAVAPTEWLAAARVAQLADEVRAQGSMRPLLDARLGGHAVKR